MFGRIKHTLFACVANLGKENSRLSAVVAMYTFTEIVCIYRLSALVHLNCLYVLCEIDVRCDI